MPRPERPIDPAAGPVARFAHELRELRNQAGCPPYRAMQVRSHVSYASLSRAAAGRKLPTWPVTRGFVLACGGDPDEWKPRWEAARDASSHPNCARIGGPLPDPTSVHTVAELRRAVAGILPRLDPSRVRSYQDLLAALRAVVAAADISPAAIERETGGRLAAGRAAAVLDGAQPAGGEEWVLLLRACGLRDEVRPWVEAWGRLDGATAGGRGKPARVHGGRQAGFGAASPFLVLVLITPLAVLTVLLALLAG